LYTQEGRSYRNRWQSNVRDLVSIVSAVCGIRTHTPFRAPVSKTGESTNSNKTANCALRNLTRALDGLERPLQNSALGGTRTRTAFATALSTLRVYQFHHECARGLSNELRLLSVSSASFDFTGTPAPYFVNLIIVTVLFTDVGVDYRYPWSGVLAAGIEPTVVRDTGLQPALVTNPYQRETCTGHYFSRRDLDYGN
jgi:hypothetical protein